MLAVEKAWHVEIGADVLDDDVRRVAPATDRYVAVRQGESLERRRIRAANDVDARTHVMRQARGIQGVRSLETALEMHHDLLLAGSGAIAELTAKRCSRTRIDAE
jgi:hypothetical protein